MNETTQGQQTSPESIWDNAETIAAQTCLTIWCELMHSNEAARNDPTAAADTAKAISTKLGFKG